MCIEELNKLKYQVENLSKTKQYLQQQIEQQQKHVQEYNLDLEEILETREYYKKAVDLIYERSVVELKDLLNTALAYGFKDRNFEMDIQLSDKRGKSLQFIISENGKPVNLKCAMGMGVKCVISAVLHMYYLQCNGSNVLILDETYSNISKGYVPFFFDFIQQMCEKLDFTMIIITHDERFLDYGNKTYTFKLGEVLVNEK